MEQNELRMNLQVPQTSPGEYLVLRADLPGVDPENIGILLLDSKANRLYCRMRRDMHEFAEVDADWFEHLADDIREKSQELGAQQYLAWMESTLSNILLISERERIPVDDFEKTAARLYACLLYTSGCAGSDSQGSPKVPPSGMLVVAAVRTELVVPAAEQSTPM